jgi:hypothetical protein
MERVLLKENNYQEWASYVRNELLARGLWDIVQGITERPRNPEVPESASTTTPATGGAPGGVKKADGDGEAGASAAADILAGVQARMTAVNETTPESRDAVYLSDFRRYLIQRENYIKDVGKATAEIRRSIHPSIRKQYEDILYDSAPGLLWETIEKDRKRVAKIDASAGLFKLNAIKRADFDSPSAYHSELLDIATEVRNTGTVLSEEVLAFFMMQGLPTGDVWLAFKNNLSTAGKAQKCMDILDQLQIFERSYACDRHGASAYKGGSDSVYSFFNVSGFKAGFGCQ